jgi:hypothetical protein
MGAKPGLTDVVLPFVPEADGAAAVDLLKQRDMDRAVQETFRKLHELHDGGRNLPVMYYMSLIVLAGRYVAVQDIQRAMDLLTLVPVSFFTKNLPTLMLTDARFASIAVKVANAIVEGGIVDPVYRHRPAAEILPDSGRA